mgnify:CR=1 FL=1
MKLKQINLSSEYIRSKRKIKYNKKLSGRFRLYLRDRNSLHSLETILSLFDTDVTLYN